jgi:hypothetical protein
VWANLVLWIALFLLVAIDLNIVLLAFWSAWQTGDWENLDYHLIGAAIPFALLFLLLVFPFWRGNALPAMDALRRAAIESRVNGLLDSAQLEKSDATEVSIGTEPERFGHVGALSNRQAAERLGRLFPIAAILLQPITLLFSLYDINQESVLPLGTYLPDSKAVDTVEIVLGATVLIMALFLFTGMRKYRRGVPITADEWGIQWYPRRNRTISLAWHDVCSFFMFSYGSISGNRFAGLKTQVYVLDGGDALLVWQRYPALSSVSGAVNQRKEVDRFVKLVVARTHTTPRDLTDLAEELASDGAPNPDVLAALRQRGTDYGQAAPLHSSIQAPERPRRGLGRRVVFGLVLALLPIVLIGGAFGAKAKLRDYRSSARRPLPSGRGGMAGSFPLCYTACIPQGLRKSTPVERTRQPRVQRTCQPVTASSHWVACLVRRVRPRNPPASAVGRVNN